MMATATTATIPVDNLLARMTVGPWGNPVMPNDVMAGAVKPGEGQLLYGFVRALAPEHVLEIGTGYGLSTIHLAAACRDNGAGQVHTVEINGERQRQAIAHIGEAGLLDWVRFYTGMPEGVRFGFVLLDGPHEAEPVGALLEWVHGALTPGAVVAVHDATWQDHVRAAAGDQWEMILLPTSSFAGLALLARK